LALSGRAKLHAKTTSTAPFLGGSPPAAGRDAGPFPADFGLVGGMLMRVILTCNAILRIIRTFIRKIRCYIPFVLVTSFGACPAMYVCVCNGLTSRQVEAVAHEHASTGAVYRALGVEPRCGKCIPTIRGMISARRRETACEPMPDAVPAR
jgi:bacterioferritin-associated ferredoxin